MLLIATEGRFRVFRVVWEEFRVSQECSVIIGYLRVYRGRYGKVWAVAYSGKDSWAHVLVDMRDRTDGMNSQGGQNIVRQI